MKALSFDTSCENCGAFIEVMLYPAEAGQPDPNKSNCCPPTPSYNDPSECPECSHPILIEDINTRLWDAKEAAEDFKAECEMERRRENSE